MIVDEIVIKIQAGNGGAGAVAFDKNMMSKGAAGGSGGRGGSVYFEGVSDLTTLNQFRFKKDVKAVSGEPGRGQWRDGRDGEDLILKIPVGTVITNTETGEAKELTKIGEQILIAQGGRGGKGNFLFRGPKNTSPTQFQPGLPGDKADLKLELKMIADVGLIGLPNAGKSSLLNALTAAKAKIGNYAFTTLEPNLGAYYELILADIPGLIEGAAEGRGLGSKFLRHIERTKRLFHLIAVDSEDPVRDYRTIREELKKHSPELAEKTETVFLSKSDTVSEEKLASAKAALEQIGVRSEPISVNTEEGVRPVRKELEKITAEKRNI